MGKRKFFRGFWLEIMTSAGGISPAQICSIFVYCGRSIEKINRVDSFAFNHMARQVWVNCLLVFIYYKVWMIYLERVWELTTAKVR